MLHLRLSIIDDRTVSLRIIHEEMTPDELIGTRSIVIPIPLDSGENMEKALDIVFDSVRVLFANAIGVKVGTSFMDRHTAALIQSIAHENEERANQGDKTSQLIWAKAILVADQSGVPDDDFRRACDLLHQFVLDGDSEVDRFIREELPALKWLRDRVRKH
jgi:hypothetical protein